MSQSPDRLVKPSVRGLPRYKAGVSPELLDALAKGRTVARLASNENLYGASPRVYEAIQRARDVNLYPDGASTVLRQALAEHLQVDADRLLVSTGSENVLRAIFQCVLEPSDRVVCLQPTFLLAEILTQAAGARHVGVSYDGELAFPLEALQDAVSGGAKLLYIANPNNPTGHGLTPEALRSIVDHADPDTLIVIDEAYYEYAVHHDGYESSIPWLEASGRPYVVLRTFSKAYGLAGLRVGYGVFYHPDLISLVAAASTVFDVGTISQAAALAALADQAHLNRTVSATLDEKTRVLEALEASGLRVFPSFGNFVSLWFPALDEALALEKTLASRAVFVKALPARSGEGLVRVTIGRPEDNDLYLQGLRGL